MTTPLIGIDLGTTNTRVAFYKDRNVEIIVNDDGNCFIPSCVSFTDEGRVVGNAALKQLTLNPYNTIYGTKRLLGSRCIDSTFQNDKKYLPFEILSENNKREKAVIKVTENGVNKYIFPEQISGMVLTKIKELAEKVLRTKVFNVVLTIPTYLRRSQMEAIIDAATIADLNVVRIISGTSAAALYYGFEKRISKQQKVLILDLGGGTCNASVLTIDNEIVEVNSTVGLDIGGDDFDNKLFVHLINEFHKKFKKDVTTNACAHQKVRIASEKAKIALSTTMTANVDIDFLIDGIDFHTSITRDKFDDLNDDLFKKILDVVIKALSDAKLTVKQINEVILIGGSSKIPKIQKLIQQYFDGKPLYKLDNPENVIVTGAALLAAILQSYESAKPLDVILLDVTPVSLGIDMDTDNMFALIKRDTILPIKESVPLQTVPDKQKSFRVDILEGEQKLKKDCHFINGIQLSGVGEIPIEVIFEVDVNHTLTVSIIETQMKKCTKLVLSTKGRLTKSEIKKLKNNDDEIEKNKIAAHKKLEDYCFKTKIHYDNNTNISEDDKIRIIDKCKEITGWLYNLQKLASVDEYEYKQRQIDNLIK